MAVRFAGPSAASGLRACPLPASNRKVRLRPDRATQREAFRMLEPCAGKLARTVLRGGTGSNAGSLLDPQNGCLVMER